MKSHMFPTSATYSVRIEPRRGRRLRWLCLGLGILSVLAMYTWIAGVELWQWDIQLASSLGLDNIDSGLEVAVIPVYGLMVGALAACLTWFVLARARSLISATGCRRRIPTALGRVQCRTDRDFRPPRMTLRA